MASFSILKMEQSYKRVSKKRGLETCAWSSERQENAVLVRKRDLRKLLASKVQNLLGHCSQHLDKGETHQGPVVLGIAMVAIAEELGLEMEIRSLEHLLQYGEQNIRRAIPFALGLLYISNPKVRIAQGLVHLGKGLLTLNSYHSDRFLLSPTTLAGLITMLHACLDMKAIVLGKYHYVFYFLVLAMQPRMLLTVNENLKPLSVPVRVGQVGRPKTTTGFQTHSTPVLLAAGDRAELTMEKYIPLSPILEGFIILEENPNYREEYLPGPDDMLVLDIAYSIYKKIEEYLNALEIALFMDNAQMVTEMGAMDSSVEQRRLLVRNGGANKF
ncbi:26S proteasome non-ATPase regulatory subunit 2-like A [Glycine soja]|uniref:26S proteasome non-ATPase regulatory subunit 2-like A n=1 Tax=Glycine soja TaxID=3848 RepID=A0A445KL85_GLYSO|nr:26S proteasome non-ATPase regulatory subunit 2-like A [Glycine soja]